MEAGYTTIDLVMLAVAAFIIWVVMRTPKGKAHIKEKLTRSGSRAAAQQNFPLSS